MPKYHQLAAIMFADISGYTALMQQDEQLAIRHREKFKNKVSSETLLHQGRVLPNLTTFDMTPVLSAFFEKSDWLIISLLRNIIRNSA